MKNSTPSSYLLLQQKSFLYEVYSVTLKDSYIRNIWRHDLLMGKHAYHLPTLYTKLFLCTYMLHNHKNAGCLMLQCSIQGFLNYYFSYLTLDAISGYPNFPFLTTFIIDDLIVLFKCMQAANAFRDAGLEVLNDVVFNQVIVSDPDPSRNPAIMHTVQRSGECWAGPGKWFGRDVIRFSVCSWATTEQDIIRAVDAFSKARFSNEAVPT